MSFVFILNVYVHITTALYVYVWKMENFLLLFMIKLFLNVEDDFEFP